jgi:sugar phosphate permease
LGLVSTYIINQWWMRRRGTINGIAGVAMALMGVGAYPNLINWLIPLVGWRSTYMILGLALLLLMVPVALIFFRSRPELYGQFPDGVRPRPAVPGQAGDVEDNWTAAEATRTAAFWIIVIGLASISMLSTGLTFHMVSIFADNALPASIAAAVFIPIAATTAVVNLVSGVLVDRLPVRFVLATALILQVAALWMAQGLTGTGLAIVYGMVLGGLMGLQRTVSTVALATYFGRLHLGSISGTASTVLVGASALGPLPMALARDFLGQYNMALSVLSLIPLALAVVSLWMRKPERKAVA